MAGNCWIGGIAMIGGTGRIGWLLKGLVRLVRLVGLVRFVEFGT